MNRSVSLNQFNFNAPAPEKTKNNFHQSSKNEKSFAEKMAALQKKHDSPDSLSQDQESTKKPENLNLDQRSKKDKTSLAERDKSDGDLKKVDKKKVEEIKENIFNLLAQLNLTSEEQPKIESVLNKVGFSKEQIQTVNKNISAADSAFTELNEGALKESFSDLETLLSELEEVEADSEIVFNKKNKLAPLINLLKEIESGGNSLTVNQLFNEEAVKTLNAVQNDNKSSLKENESSKAAGIIRNKDDSVKTAQKLNFDFNVLDEDIFSQQVNLEQKDSLKKEFLSQDAENNALKNNGELKFFNSMNNRVSADLNLEGLSKFLQSESSEKVKDSNLDFFGIESFSNTELETTASENIYDLNNNTKLKQNYPVKDQFVEKFKGEYSAAKNEMSLKLKPDSLGKIEIKLNLNQGKIDAKMIVENNFVQSQLENSMQEIKSDLLKQGINIEQFKIETAKNAPQQVEKQNGFAFNDQNSAFSDGETGQNQEYEQRQFFQGQYYVQRTNKNSNLNSDDFIMRQQEIINRAAFSNGKLNLIV